MICFVIGKQAVQYRPRLFNPCFTTGKTRDGEGNIVEESDQCSPRSYQDLEEPPSVDISELTTSEDPDTLRHIPEPHSLPTVDDSQSPNTVDDILSPTMIDVDLPTTEVDVSLPPMELNSRSPPTGLDVSFDVDGILNGLEQLGNGVLHLDDLGLPG